MPFHSSSDDTKRIRDGEIGAPRSSWQETFSELREPGAREPPTLPSYVEALMEDLTREIALCDLIGSSPVFRRVLDEIKILSQTDATLLITGETGTGKDMCARAIHYTSARASKPFIPVNCGSIPDELFENEFFGHERGAFTDARDRYPGLVRAAEGGTIFLDDIESLHVKNQAKLLLLLQGSSYTPLGSVTSIKANVRVIAATNEDLSRRVCEKSFRGDLYFRLAVLTLVLPPLRQRVDDIPALANVFVQRYGTKYEKSGLQLTDSAIDKLRLYSWPGNVRELESVVHRAVLHARSVVISEIDVSWDQTNSPQSAQGECSVSPFGQAKREVVTRFERDYILRLLNEYGWNISEAARRAGKDRRAFWELMRKHHISREYK